MLYDASPVVPHKTIGEHVIYKCIRVNLRGLRVRSKHNATLLKNGGQKRPSKELCINTLCI